MRTLRSVLTLALVAILAIPTAAAEATCEREVAFGNSETTYSVDVDLCQPECLFSAWIYQDDASACGADCLFAFWVYPEGQQYDCEREEEAQTAVS